MRIANNANHLHNGILSQVLFIMSYIRDFMMSADIWGNIIYL